MALIYLPSSDAWGLQAKDGETSLVFSGTFKLARIWRDNIDKIMLKPRRAVIAGNAVDVFRLYSPAAVKAWNRAVWRTVNQDSGPVGCVDLFLSLIRDASVKKIFSRFGADLNDARALLKNYMALSRNSAAAEELKKIPFEAFLETEKLRSPAITPLMLLAALLKVLPPEHILQAVFINLGLSLNRLETLTVWLENLNYDFPGQDFSKNLLHCCQRTQWLERHNRISFKLSAIEQALAASSNNPPGAIRLLVRAAGKTHNRNKKIISAV